MVKDFDLKSLKKIAKEQLKEEDNKELDIARDIISKFEEDIIEEINEIIVKGLKQNKCKIEINISKLHCLKDRKDLNIRVYGFIMDYFYYFYRKKGFFVSTKLFCKDTFFVFRSRYAKWSHYILEDNRNEF